MELSDLMTNSPGNRVVQALELYAEQLAQLQISRPWASRNDRETLSLQLDYYTNVYKAYKKKTPAYEKSSLRYLRRQIAKTRAQLRPNLIKKILYSRPVDTVRNFISGDQAAFSWHDRSLRQIQRSVVQDHNLHALTESMKKSGFNFQMEGTLKKMIEQDAPNFHIRYADARHSKSDFVLHFRKMPGSDIYFFEKFDAFARPDLDAVLQKKYSGLRQTFSRDGEISFTAREAENLVNGKSVCKNIAGKETWLVLDAAGINEPAAFRQISFDLQKALKKLPIKQLDNPTQYKAITEALKTGGQKEVTLVVAGYDSKYKLEVSPHRKTIDILDKDNSLVDLAKLPGNHLSPLTQKIIAHANRHDEVIEMNPSNRKGRRV